MLEALASLALATAATLVLLPSGASAARACSGTSAGFQYRLGELRYDSPDPSKKNGLATIAASLQSSTGTPLYECVAQWPESWAGWYKGGSEPVWGDCIFTGAGIGADDTVTFAVDWKNKTMYLSHTFACSDRPGTEGLATGSIQLDVNCTAPTDDGSSYCILKSTSTGARPTLNIATKLAAASLNATSPCADNTKRYQSWKLRDWLRRIVMEPGSSPINPKLVSDSGPSFTLQNMASGDVFRCATSGKENATFVGGCQSANGTTTTAEFQFDSQLNMLEITQHWKCDSSSLDVVGIAYMQAACDREFNSDEFTCTSLPNWIGSGPL